MRCEDVSSELAARAHDEELADDPAILDHLERCPDCAGLEEDLAPVRAHWRRAREHEIEPGADAWTRLRARIERDRRPRRRPPLLLALPALAAAASILVFALLVEPAQDDAAALVPQYGTVLVDGEPCPAGQTTRIRPGARVAGSGDTPARLELESAALVLSAGAAFSWSGSGRLEIDAGRMLVRTARPLTIRAAETTVEVLGTEFALERTGGGLAVLVLEGRVRLKGSGRSVDVPAGSRAYAPLEGPPGPPTRTPLWPALDWIGTPRLRLEPLPRDAGGSVELAIRIETDAREEIPLRPFNPASADFLLEITDADGRRFPVKILPDMIVESSRPPGHRARFPLVRGHPYRLRVRLDPALLGEEPGSCTVVASYNVRGSAGDRLWQGRLTSEPRRIRR